MEHLQERCLFRPVLQLKYAGGNSPSSRAPLAQWSLAWSPFALEAQWGSRPELAASRWDQEMLRAKVAPETLFSQLGTQRLLLGLEMRGYQLVRQSRALLATSKSRLATPPLRCRMGDRFKFRQAQAPRDLNEAVAAEATSVWRQATPAA